MDYFTVLRALAFRVIRLRTRTVPMREMNLSLSHPHTHVACDGIGSHHKKNNLLITVKKLKDQSWPVLTTKGKLTKPACNDLRTISSSQENKKILKITVNCEGLVINSRSIYSVSRKFGPKDQRPLSNYHYGKHTI